MYDDHGRVDDVSANEKYTQRQRAKMKESMEMCVVTHNHGGVVHGIHGYTRRIGFATFVGHLLVNITT